MTLRVAIFDDVLAVRREVFHIPGLAVEVYGDADDVLIVCSGEGAPAPEILCMDYAMGPDHVNGADAIRDRIRDAEAIRTAALRALELDPGHDGAWHVLGRWHAEIMRRFESLEGSTLELRRHVIPAGLALEKVGLFGSA